MTGDTDAASTGTAGAVSDEAALLRRHLAGDPDAFAEIFRRHRDRLWAVALRTIGDPDEAADALQDALISAMRHASSFRGDAQVTTWLHRIVVNACLDRLRRRAARPTVALPDDDHAQVAATAGAGVRDEFDERDTAADVRAALATLPYDQRAAIVLVDIEGYSIDETAAILEVPTGTVKSRCARGRAKLLPLLSHLHTQRAGASPSATVSDSAAHGPVAGNPGLTDGVEPPMPAPREDLR